MKKEYYTLLMSGLPEKFLIIRTLSVLYPVVILCHMSGVYTSCCSLYQSAM